MSDRTIAALYHSSADADAARTELVAIGVVPEQISIVTEDSATTAQSDRVAGRERGILGSLRDLFVPDDDADAYAEGIHRGGRLLTVRLAGENADQVMAILERHNPVDIDESRAGRTAAVATERQAAAAPIAPSAAAFDSAAASARTSRDAREEVIPLMEEQIQIGKEEVQRGRIRVRSYVVETPVQEQIQLRDETVRVERRTVDRPVEPGGDAFRERTVEMTETDEQAVVGKTARVREEVVIGKDVDVRTETVSDKVRRTEVDVEDDRTAPERPADRRTGSDRR